MPLLGTLWWPSLNPIGPASVSAAVLCLGMWLAAEGRFQRRERGNDWVIIGVPPLLLAFALFYHLLFAAPRSFANAQDFVACYLCIAAATGLSCKGVRLKAQDLRVLGAFNLFMALGFFACEAVNLPPGFIYALRAES